MSPSKQAIITWEHLKKFAVRWLRLHWSWLIDLLQAHVTESPKMPPVAKTFEHKDEAPVETWVGRQVDPEEPESEQLLAELGAGNLQGWRLYYALNRSTAGNGLIELEGSTLDERERVFDQFLLDNGISCSIKPASVIRALEWVTAAPDRVEFQRIRQEIGNEVFKKVKRGKVRIFYVLKPELKQLVFFVHQKQAMGYSFT